jgi:hypothetical protein
VGAISHWSRRVQARLERVTRDAADAVVRTPLLHRFVRHVHGPRAVGARGCEPVLTTVAREGDFYYRPFVEHHLALGVRHVVVLVNGSPDAAVDQLGSYRQVTVLSADCAYASYETVMRRYLMSRFSPDGWCLHLDIDELFDFPCSCSMSLAGFIGYLEHRRFNAVLAQMLDLFSDEPMVTLPAVAHRSLHEIFPCYDLSAIRAEVHGWGRLPEGLSFHSGGIRHHMFGTDNCLTKFPLLQGGSRAGIVNVHAVRRAEIADVTALISHFPFSRGFPDKVRDAVRTRRYGPLTTPEYAAYTAALDADAELRIAGPSARRWRGVEALVTEGFLTVSTAYQAWCEDER